ncbi:hypothetical protein FVB9288_02706 [Flavobacterium sp. CECT 9288]|nr:hypothetical protein FVB9288_02706 [Flavobacterium sp. CECT 9288]
MTRQIFDFFLANSFLTRQTFGCHQYNYAIFGGSQMDLYPEDTKILE